MDIKDFNVKGDGITDNTVALQNAIDICAEKNCELVISEGVYNTGTLFARTNSKICIEKGAILNGINQISAYSVAATFVDAVGKVRGKALFVIHKVNNVSIYGDGKICGNGSKLDSEERPFLVRLDNAENVKIKGIRLEASPSWCLHIDKSKNVNIENITIYNRGCDNNDAIDIDSSENITITGCDISSGDDGICVKATSNRPCKNVLVDNCRVSTDWGAFKIGTESVGDMTNMTVTNCEFYDVVGGAIKIVPVDGANVDNVRIENIKMQNCTGPIFIANGERNREYAGEKRETFSTIKNIKIKNITGDVVPAPERGIWDNEVWGNSIGGIILSGTKKKKIENITIEDINITMPGGYVGELPDNVREMGKMYPEFHRFDPVPAKGVYIRHADRVKMNNIKMEFKSKDVRETIFLEDAQNCEVDF